MTLATDEFIRRLLLAELPEFIRGIVMQRKWRKPLQSGHDISKQ